MHDRVVSAFALAGPKSNLAAMLKTATPHNPERFRLSAEKVAATLWTRNDFWVARRLRC
jgi:hypothetical protein